MNGNLLEYYYILLERLLTFDKLTKEMTFNLMNIDDKEKLEEMIYMEDKELFKTLSDD